MGVAVLIAVVETLFRFASDQGWPLPIAFSAAPALLALATVGPVVKFFDLRRTIPASRVVILSSPTVAS